MKIVSRGQIFELEETLVQKGNSTVIYAPNGVGKSSLSAPFIRMSGDVSSSSRVEDLLGGITPYSVDLERVVNGREVFVLDLEGGFSNLNTKNKSKIIISKNANVMEKILSNLKDNLDNITQLSNPIRKEWDKNGVDFKKVKKMIPFKKPFSFSNYEFALGDFDLNKKLDLNLVFTTKQDYEKSRKFIRDVEEHYKELNEKVLDEVNKITPYNFEAYSELITVINKHKVSFEKGVNCPFCDHECNFTGLLKEWNAALEKYSKEGYGSIKNLFNVYTTYHLKSDFEWTDWNEPNEFPLSYTVKQYEEKYKQVDFETDYTNALLQSSPLFLESMVLIKKYNELKKEAPILSNDFLAMYREFVGEVMNVSKLGIEISVQGKQIVLSQNEGEFKKETISTSTLKMLNMAFEYVVAKLFHVNSVIIVDDPLDSNDLRNSSFIIDKLKQLPSKQNTVIVFTHNVQFLKGANDE